MNVPRRKLIEVALPLPEINDASAYDKMPGIRELVKWENSNNETVLNKARAEILRSCNGNPPPVFDPFCGGGSIPLEAQRLGLEAHASDLNPVPVLITKALIEIPPRFAGKPPVNPESRRQLLGTPASLPASRSAHTPASKDAGAPSLDARKIELLKRIAKYEDAGHGACWLRDPRVAELVENALLHFDGQRYRLIAWCIMPNHVHALIETWERWPLAGVLHSWKSFTASEANKILGRSGTFWFREYHDRYIRNAEHYGQAIRYIEENPVKAGLAKLAVDWRFSSARRKAAPGPPASLPASDSAPRPAGKDAGAPSSWKGAAGLAEDIRYYGQWMRDEAEKRIRHLYPKVQVIQESDGSYRHATAEDLVHRKSKIVNLTVIGWLWARTVASPNPAARGAHVPLVRSFWLSTKAGKKAWVEPVVDQSTMTYRFEVRTGNGEPRTATVSRNGGVCLLTGSPMPLDYIRLEGKAGRMGTRLMGVVTEGTRGRIYISPSDEQEGIAESAEVPERIPDTEMVPNSRYMTPTGYGMTKHYQLFTRRQLVAIATFCNLVEEVRASVVALPDGSESYADAVATYLAFAVSKGANYWSSICKWHQGAEKMVSTYGLPVLPMAWDYTEANPFSDSTGNWSLGVEQAANSVAAAPASGVSQVFQADARQPKNPKVPWMVSTDPPYYDNVPYADLSDLFYIWLRRTLQRAYPELLGTVLVPKTTELVADPFRQGGKAEAQKFFERGLGEVFRVIRQESSQAFPFTVFYAFKQQESDRVEVEDGEKSNHVSTGWETMLEALVSSGFSVDGTWPMRTEQSGGLRAAGRNSLASSIILVCRPRPKDAGVASRRDFLASLKRELPEALRNLQKGNIAPVDLAQAAIGPGMAVFSRYARVLETDGSPMGVRTALALMNQSLDEVLAEQGGEFDAETRWALAWFDQYGFTEGAYGQAETLCTAKNTSVSGMVEAGILAAKGGKVRLLKKEELGAPASLPAGGNQDEHAGRMPALPGRLTIWLATHQLIRALDQGEQAAAELLRKLGPISEIARELSYRLYTVCERKKWAKEALGYNALVISWPDITRLAQEQKTRGPVQGEMI